MRRLFLFFIIFLIPLAHASWIFDTEGFDIKASLSSKGNVTFKRHDAMIEEAGANLTFFPRSTWQQAILKEEHIPEDTVLSNGYLLMNWKHLDNLDFNHTYLIRTRNDYIRIKERIPFPIESYPKELMIYTFPSATIDSDNKLIMGLASSLVEGEDDLYKASVKVAEWVSNNVEYSLETVAVEASQTASWVLRNRYGVCDELTNLFIAMMRSLGVPARFVSGVAYTDSPLFDEPWGPHGWAEVYFPSHGWVPFDVSYGEFGFVDALHIVSKYSTDPTGTSTEYEWKSRHVDLDVEPMLYKAEIVESRGEKSPLMEISVDTMKEDIGFGSMNVVQARVKNLKDFYLSSVLLLGETELVEILDDEKKTVVLMPGEEKTVYWKIKVAERLNPRKFYMFPVNIINARNQTASTTFEVSMNNLRYDEDYVDVYLQKSMEKPVSTAESLLSLDCYSEKTFFYTYENGSILCSVSNKGNTILDDLNVCLSDECFSMNLTISETRDLVFPFPTLSFGAKHALVSADNYELTTKSYVEYFVADTPSLKILELEYPSSVRYSDIYNVSLLMHKESHSSPEDLKVMINNEQVEIDILEKDQYMIFAFFAKELDPGVNEYNVSISYSDQNDREYSVEDTITISLADLNLWQKLMIFIRDLL